MPLAGKALTTLVVGVLALELGGRAYMAYRRWLWTYRRAPAAD